MNKTLVFLVENKHYALDDSELAKELSIDIKTARYIFNKVCEISNTGLNLITSEKVDSGKYFIVDLHELEIERFLESGGFEKYLEIVEKEPLVIYSENTHVGNNSGTYNQTANTGNRYNFPSPNSNLKTIIIGLFVTIVGGLILWFITN